MIEDSAHESIAQVSSFSDTNRLPREREREREYMFDITL